MKWSTAICLCVAMCCVTFLTSLLISVHQQRASLVTITPDPPKTLQFDPDTPYERANP